ncbi:hypothetical protein MBLNU230_g7760t1 [Neophaeotheca triangularis]
MAPWLAFLEAWAVQQLLRTPGFHRGVEKFAKTVYRYRNNLPPEQKGGTHLDDPSKQSFVKHYFEELQTQLGRAERKEQQQRVTRAPGGKPGVKEEPMDESADGAWREISRGMKAEEVKGGNGAKKSGQGFLGEYSEALRQQFRGGK